MKHCPKCGNQFPDEANFCPKDAGRLEPIEPDAGDTVSNGLYGGRFELGDRLGGGQTGEVYRADDTESGQAVALKLVDPAVFPTPLTLQRTERELKQLERLEAPGVAKVYGHGRQDEQLWVASELLEGTSLEQMVASSGAMSLDDATAMVLAIGRALGDSAKAGVIHRDLAPKNVMVNDGEVKLINFGIARPESDGVQGVPEFVSPEQVDGKPVDQRSNIYSLGAIYYYLLTGQPPFVGAPAQVFEQHRSAEPAAPSTLASVPQSVDAVVLKALEKSSSKRFMTLRQLLEQVEEAASGDAGGTQRMGSAGKKKKKAAAQTMMGGFSLDDAAAAAAAAKGNGASAEVPRNTAPMSSGDAAHAVSSAAEVEQMLTSPAAPEAAPQQPVEPQPAPQQPAPQQPAPQQPAAPQPAPQQPVAPQVAAPQATAPSGKGKGKARTGGQRKEKSSKGKFRETMWFKKGALDEAAAAEAAAAKQGALVSDKADEMPLEDRYNDDGSINAHDQQSFSLRTGHTQAMAAMKDDVPTRPRADVTEADLISEMKGGRGKILLIAAVVVVIAIAVILAFAL